MTTDTLALLEKNFNFNAVQNSEIAHDWLLISIRNNYEPAFGKLIAYLTEIGRMKLIVPLYEEMMQQQNLMNLAQQIYQKARPGYHNLARFKLDPIVGHDSQNAEPN